MAAPVVGRLSREGSLSRENGGPPAGEPMEDAHRSAEQLFERRPVEEVRGVASRAREQVVAKQEELRQVVGHSYRDFIDSADSIVAMHKCCQQIVGNLAHIAERVERLADASEGEGIASPASSGRGEEAPSLGVRLFALGSRAKALLDTPEAIWAVLEAEKANVSTAPGSGEASSRVLYHGARLAAHAVVLWQTRGDELSAKFPLLAHQKPQLLNLCRRLKKSCEQRLEEAHLDTLNAADALASTALLDIACASPIFAGDGNGAVAPGEGRGLLSLWLDLRLSSVSKWVKSWQDLPLAGQVLGDVTCKVEQLFEDSRRGSPDSLSSLSLPDLEADMWYEPLPGHEAEISLWRDYLAQFKAEAAPLPPGEVAAAFAKWLPALQAECGALFRQNAGGLEGVSQLSDAERRIHGQVTTSGSELVGFDQACSSLLRRPLNLWMDLYERSFQARAVEIVEVKLSAIFEAAAPHIAKGGGADWQRSLREVLGALHGELETVFLQTMEFMLLPCEPSAVQPRVVGLQSHVQDACYKLISDILSDIGRQRAALQGASGDPTSQAHGLFLSNLCDALQVENNALLALIFGSPALWIQPEASAREDVSEAASYAVDRARIGATVRRLVSSLGADELTAAQDALSKFPYSRLAEMREELQASSLAAAGLFYEGACDRLRSQMSASLARDRGLKSASPDSAWDEIAVNHAGEGGEDVTMKFSLPSVPSPYVMQHLFVASLEVQSARFVHTNAANLSHFKAQLLAGLLASFDAFHAAHAAQVSEKGILQMLFDLGLTCDILGGGGAAGRGRQGSDLLAKLSGELDPIDWATYEPYLWQNQQQYFRRCALLFDDFVSASGAREESRGAKLKSAGRSNVIELYSNVPRFAYLPVSTPNALRGETAEDLLRSLSMGDDLKAGGAGKGAGGAGEEGPKGPGILGGLLSERAAEATAIAQDLFSGAGFFTSLTGNASAKGR